MERAQRREIYAKNTLHFCFSITVPGAIAGWFDAYEKWGSGKVTFEEILTPAVQLAEEGFPVSELSSHAWRNCIPKLLKQNPDVKENPFVLEGNRGPEEGEYVTNHRVAKCLRLIGKHGKKVFMKV